MKLMIPETARFAYGRLRRNRTISLFLLIASCLAALVAFFAINYNFRASLSVGRAHTCFLNSKWDIITQSKTRGGESQVDDDSSEEVRGIPIGGNYTLEIDAPENKYGCYFVEWVFILSFVITFFLIWFFAIFKTSENRFYRQKPTTSARLVPPTVFLGVVFSLLQGIAAIVYTVGFAKWCNHGVSIDNVPSHCSSLRTIALKLSEKSAIRTNIFNVAILAAVAAIISSLLWVALVILLSLRLRRRLDFPESVEMPVQIFQNQKTKVFPLDQPHSAGGGNQHMLAAAAAAIKAVNRIEESDRRTAPLSSQSTPVVTSSSFSDSKIAAM